jgi:hypothetical protein
MKKIAIATILVTLSSYPVVTFGQNSPVPITAVESKSTYAPGLGEFMLQTQTRHLKLWLAGNVGNWDLADYEIDELKEGLEDAVKHVPNYKGMPVGQMMESVVMRPLGDVEKAIKARDRAKFVSSFDKLTEACNACHQAASRAFIVIQRPSGAQFPNQSFAPKPR